MDIRASFFRQTGWLDPPRLSTGAALGLTLAGRYEPTTGSGTSLTATWRGWSRRSLSAATSWTAYLFPLQASKRKLICLFLILLAVVVAAELLRIRQAAQKPNLFTAKCTSAHNFPYGK